MENKKIPKGCYKDEATGKIICPDKIAKKKEL